MSRVRAFYEANAERESGRLDQHRTVLAIYALRYAPMRWAAKHDPELLVREPDATRAILEDGLLVPPGQFVDAYCMNPGDLEPLMADAGFERRALLGCEGLVSFIQERVNELSGPAWEAWVDLNYRAAHDPTLLGASEHILYVGAKVA